MKIASAMETVIIKTKRFLAGGPLNTDEDVMAVLVRRRRSPATTQNRKMHPRSECAGVSEGAIRDNTRFHIDPYSGKGGRWHTGPEVAVRMAAFSASGDTTAVRCTLERAANNSDMCTRVRSRPPAQIIRGVTPHKNIQEECNVTI